MTETRCAPVEVEGAANGSLRQEHTDEPCRRESVTLVGGSAYKRWLERANRQRDLTAYEEAGHWVGGWLAGFDMSGSSVTIVPDGACWGCVSFDEAPELMTVGPAPSLLGGFDSHPHDRFRLEATVVMLFTGPLAAGRALLEGHASAPPPPHPHTSFERRQEQMNSIEVGKRAAAAGVVGGVSDQHSVERLLEESTASPAEAETYGLWLWARAETMVRSRTFWRPCRAIAEQLLLQETLTCEECVELADDALRPEPLPEATRRWPRESLS